VVALPASGDAMRECCAVEPVVGDRDVRLDHYRLWC